jgi:hypothetical protein
MGNRLTTHELKNVRRLVKEVLMHRTDVETFLLSSLDLVRAVPSLYTM